MTRPDPRQPSPEPWLAAALCLTAVLAAWAPAAAAPPPAAPPLFDNLGTHHHRITASSPQAQRYFNQGLVLTFAFNHAEAVRSFREAARLDPGCAMCYWGIALALGPNINAAMEEPAAREAYAAVQEAIQRWEKASEAEKAYIQALATRYQVDPPADRTALDAAYVNAMRQLARRFPDDMDAAALFAEAIMDTMPWHYWTEDGQPRPGTLELLVTLEAIMARAPDHPLALHLYIHAVEASPNPKRGEAAADRLGNLVPGAGHLVHMPAHIYFRVGRYHDAALANERAALADEAYFAKSGMQGLYSAAYYSHNIHFLWQAAAIEGRSAEAVKAARKLIGILPAELVRDTPGAEQFLPMPLFALAQFGHWEEILNEPMPAEEFAYHRAMWHYARGLALAAAGRLEEVRHERGMLNVLADTDAVRRLETARHGFPASRLLLIAGLVLDAEIEEQQGRMGEQLRYLEDAVEIQDSLPYMEPPYWYYPVRQTLGAALLRSGRAQEAEAVFREDLKRNPRSGWSLYGLARSLEDQGSAKAAADAQRQFESAWKYADVTLTGSLTSRPVQARRN